VVLVTGARGVQKGQIGLFSIGAVHPAEEVVEGPVLHHHHDDVLDARGLRRGHAARRRPQQGNGVHPIAAGWRRLGGGPQPAGGRQRTGCPEGAKEFPSTDRHASLVRRRGELTLFLQENRSPMRKCDRCGSGLRRGSGASAWPSPRLRWPRWLRWWSCPCGPASPCRRPRSGPPGRRQERGSRATPTCTTTTRLTAASCARR